MFGAALGAAGGLAKKVPGVSKVGAGGNKLGLGPSGGARARPTMGGGMGQVGQMGQQGPPMQGPPPMSGNPQMGGGGMMRGPMRPPIQQPGMPPMQQPNLPPMQSPGAPIDNGGAMQDMAMQKQQAMMQQQPQGIGPRPQMMNNMMGQMGQQMRGPRRPMY